MVLHYFRDEKRGRESFFPRPAAGVSEKIDRKFGDQTSIISGSLPHVQPNLMPSRHQTRVRTSHRQRPGSRLRQRLATEARRREQARRHLLSAAVVDAISPQYHPFVQPLGLATFLSEHPLRDHRHAIYAFRTRFNGDEWLVKFGLTNRQLSDRLGDHLADPHFQASTLIGVWYFPSTAVPELIRWVVIRLETAIKQSLRDHGVLVTRPKATGGQYTELVEAHQENQLLRTMRRLCRAGHMREIYHQASTALRPTYY